MLNYKNDNAKCQHSRNLIHHSLISGSDLESGNTETYFIFNMLCYINQITYIYVFYICMSQFVEIKF